MTAGPSMRILEVAADTAEKSSGTSDLSIALVGLAGALIGGLATFAGVWWRGAFDARQTRADRLAGLAETMIRMRWQVETLGRKLKKQKATESTLAPLETELHDLEQNLLSAVNMLHVHAPQRMSDAANKTLGPMNQDVLMKALASFAIVVRGEVSPSWFERRQIRKQTVTEIFANPPMVSEEVRNPPTQPSHTIR